MGEHEQVYTKQEHHRYKRPSDILLKITGLDTIPAEFTKMVKVVHLS